MKSIGILSLLFLAGFWISCEQVNTGGGTGQLLSDGYISYSVNGTSVTAHDSLLPGDPSFYEIGAAYLDSTLTIVGGGVAFSGAFVQITLAHCFDTGTYLLSTDTAQSSSGALTVHDTFWSNYLTDSIHTGVLHLTQFDLAHHTLAGTFTFLAAMRNGTAGATARVINGILYNFPLNRN